jgi:RNA-directed DNA polymerase
METLVERNNMRRALEQVRRNKGAPGADGMTVDALASHLQKHWPAMRAQLLRCVVPGGSISPDGTR